MGIVRTVQMCEGLHRTVYGRALHRFISGFMLGPRVLRAYHEDSIEDQACFLPFTLHPREPHPRYTRTYHEHKLLAQTPTVKPREVKFLAHTRVAALKHHLFLDAINLKP